jgi:hypothetical protein
VVAIEIGDVIIDITSYVVGASITNCTSRRSYRFILIEVDVHLSCARWNIGVELIAQ